MTQPYIGVKMVLAWLQDKEGKAGYAVKYSDGYISWSPKDVFEEAYVCGKGLSDEEVQHIRRVILEITASLIRAHIADKTVICMDCGKVIKVNEQSKHLKDCDKTPKKGY